MQNKLGMVMVFVLLAACGKDKLDEAIGKLEGLKDKMCACKDTKCADAVRDEEKALEEDLKKSFGKDDIEKMDKSKLEKAMKLGEEMRACRDKLRDADKGASGAEAVSKVEGFATEMCACKDKACADAVNDTYTKWGTEMAKTASGASTMGPDAIKKMTDASTKYSDCYVKVATGG